MKRRNLLQLGLGGAAASILNVGSLGLFSQAFAQEKKHGGCG